MKIKKIGAIMLLPAGGKQAWSDLMQVNNNIKISAEIYENQPIVMATTKFKDGIMVAGGVAKSDQPDVFNYKFFHVFDANGTWIQSIDVSDHEDFFSTGITFILNDDESVEYELKIEEK